MRQYLLELRRKAGLSQKTVAERMASVKSRGVYSSVERGYIWPDITYERAAELAYALNTTPEYIMEKEEKEGGYVGKYHYSEFGEGSQNQITMRSEYREPLTAKEKALAAEYYEHACKTANAVMHRSYGWVTESNIMCREDFYELGLSGLLQAVKKITLKETEEPEFMNALETPERFYKWVITNRIRSVIRRAVEKRTAFVRRSEADKVSLDEKISDDSDDDFYSLHPSEFLPVTVEAESNCFLSELYSNLTDEEITACRHLMNGYTQKELAKMGVADKEQISTIKFYCIQLLNYGRVLWTPDRYLSGEAGVTYDRLKNKWHVYLSAGKKNYFLGYYDDLVTAIDVRKLAVYFRKKGCFDSWYDKRLGKGARGVCLLYPLNSEDYNEDETDVLQNESESNIQLRHTDLENHIGCCFDRAKRRWHSSIKSASLGYYSTLEEAVSIRKEAENHVEAGDFEQWYNEFRQKRKLAAIPRARISKDRDTYRVSHTYNRKTRYFGRYKTEAEAFSIAEEVNRHIDSGDFSAWADCFAESRKSIRGKVV